MRIDVIVYCGVELGVRYTDTLAVGVGRLSVTRVIVSVTLDEAQCDGDTIGDTLDIGVVEELIDSIDGDSDGLTVTVCVCT